MNKKYKIIVSGIVMFILVGVSAILYKNLNTNKVVEKGLELMSQKEYKKAIASFELALDEKPDEKEALEGKEMIEKYISAKEFLNDGQAEEANKKISEINSNYTNFSGFSDDVNELKNQIDDSIKKDEKINGSISEVRELINKKSYDEAKKLIDKIGKEKLNENQRIQVEDLGARVSTELSKIDIQKRAKEEVEKKAKEQKEKGNTVERAIQIVKQVAPESKVEYSGRTTINGNPYYTFMITSLKADEGGEAHYVISTEGGNKVYSHAPDGNLYPIN
ncbi:hypothetical protein [Clostridium sardiniense]|uniref:hypothetical protein n=1 Tax=Clostridium sardiniense TaxID=29369 RepID=UPI003D3250DF